MLSHTATLFALLNVRNSLAALVVVVVYPDACVPHVQLEAVVWIDEDGIHGLLAHHLLHEKDDVAVAVHLIVVDDCKVFLHPFVSCLRSGMSCHHLLVLHELHERHLDGCGSVLDLEYINHFQP